MNASAPEQIEDGRAPGRRAILASSLASLLLVVFASEETRAQDAIVATPVQEEPVRRLFPRIARLFERAEAGTGSVESAPAELPGRRIAVPVSPVEAPASKTVPVRDTLPGLVREALENNPELASVRQEEILKLAGSEVTGSGGLPLVAVYGTYQSQPPSGIGGIADGRSQRDAVGLLVEQPVLDWGANRGKVEMERQLARSDHWGAKVKELETVYRVTETYWRHVFFGEVIDRREAALQARLRERSAVAGRVRAGEAREVELMLIEAAVAEAEQELMSARHGHLLAEAQLRFLVGRDRDAPLLIADHLTLAPAAEPTEICLEEHPEMKRVRLAELSASTAERAARAGSLPKVLVRGRVEDSNASPGAGTTNLVPDGVNYEIGAYVSVPVGRQKTAAAARVHEANARRIQLAADAASLEASLQLRIQEAQNRLEEARKGATVARKKEAAAIEYLSLQRELGSIRNATRADVAKVESDADEARIGVLKALYDVKVARAHLEREQGLLCP